MITPKNIHFYRFKLEKNGSDQIRWKNKVRNEKVGEEMIILDTVIIKKAKYVLHESCFANYIDNAKFNI